MKQKIKTLLFFVVLLVVTLFLPVNFSNIALASFGSWGDTSLIHACKDNRGVVFLVGPGDSCGTGETQVTWLKDVDAGEGLSISRSSSGATLSLTDDVIAGWTRANETWTYVSANSFSVSGDQTAKFQKGTRVKFTQTTVKYGVVKSSSHSSGTTTVTLFANDDYSLANATITAPFFSYAASPQGYPGTFAYTPTIDGVTGSAGSFATSNLTGYFSVVGNTMTYTVEATVSNKGSWGGNIRVSIPATASIGQGTFYYLWGIVSNEGDAANALKAQNVSLSDGNAYLQFEKNFGLNLIQWSDVTSPFRIASHGDVRF